MYNLNCTQMIQVAGPFSHCRVDSKAGNTAEVLLVSGDSNEASFSPRSSPTGIPENRQRSHMVSHIWFHEWGNKSQVKTLQPKETNSPVFHEPEVFSSVCAIAHDQNGVIYEPWIAVGYVVQTWKMHKVNNILKSSLLQFQHQSVDLFLH